MFQEYFNESQMKVPYYLFTDISPYFIITFGMKSKRCFDWRIGGVKFLSTWRMYACVSRCLIIRIDDTFLHVILPALGDRTNFPEGYVRANSIRIIHDVNPFIVQPHDDFRERYARTNRLSSIIEPRKEQEPLILRKADDVLLKGFVAWLGDQEVVLKKFAYLKNMGNYP